MSKIYARWVGENRWSISSEATEEYGTHGIGQAITNSNQIDGASTVIAAYPGVEIVWQDFIGQKLMPSDVIRDYASPEPKTTL